MKTRLFILGVSSLVTLGLAAAPAIASEDPAQEDVANTTEALHKAAGKRRLFKEALDDVGLRPEQQSAVDKLESDAKGRHADVKAAKRELMTALADQIEKGTIDECAVRPQIHKVAAAVAKARPEDRKAFEELHTILDKDQRTKFVDSLEKHWKEYKKDFEPAAMAGKVAAELQLNDDQKAKLEEIFAGLKMIHDAEPGHAAHRERWAKIMEAFKGDQFELDKIAPIGNEEEHATKKLERRLWAAEAILPVLNKDQRALLAQKIRDKARGHTETGSTDAYGMEHGEEEED